MQGIYRIRNKINNKRYVGSAQNFNERWDFHKKELQKGIHYNSYLQNAWNKYGKKNFAFEIEEEVEGNREALITCEQDYLDEGFELGILYNIARRAGGGNLGPEVNQKIGEACSDPSEETRMKMSKAKMGHETTEETRAKISQTLMGSNFTEKHCVNISKASIGNERSAMPYPAFYNVKTDEYISEGINLAKICREYKLNYSVMGALRRREKVISKDGWRLA